MSAISCLPQHIAIIMDGNGRWAKQRLLPRKAGHKAGAKTVRNIIECCARRQIKALTLFAFGNENWQRPTDEVNALMALLFENLVKELPSLQKHNIHLAIIGDRARLDEKLQQQIITVEQQTAKNTGLQLNLAISYSGRWDICQAIRAIAQQVQNGQLNSAEIDQTMLAKHLSLAHLPEPDLFIRTSGEKRLSNFLLWQLAYTELYFCDCYWPEFDEQALQQAVDYYAKRERRFGKTSEQIGNSC